MASVTACCRYNESMSKFETEAPLLKTAIPGPQSLELARRLAQVESRNITCLEPTAPIFWERARAANVWDVDGNRFVDLGAGFGVANAGHANPAVVAAVQKQSQELLHAMGDVHPPAVKVELLEVLCSLYPGGVPAKGVLSSSGSDAVETALKTVRMASGRSGVVAFEGAYHGLSFGALDTTWRPEFRDPFLSQLAGRTAFAKFGEIESVRRAAEACPQPVGAVILEPIQGRGGECVPPVGFLRELRQLCDENDWLLICDEVYTGFGRTGKWFACEHEAVIPDLLCVAKGLASGMPVSACLGRTEILDHWPASEGEALHTQTFLGHPPGCAAALASIAAIRDDGLVERSAKNGAIALEKLRSALEGSPQIIEVRGVGLMIGIECNSSELAYSAFSEALQRGVILLPSGDGGQVLSITPPLCISREILDLALDILIECLL